MMSYAVGAFTANLHVWLIYYIVVLVVVRRRPPLSSSSWGDRLVRAAGDMPDPHWNQLWKPGICAGLLLAMAMFGSILAVTYLGQGIGNSVIQAKIIIRYVPCFWFYLMDLEGWRLIYVSLIIGFAFGILAVVCGEFSTTKKFVTRKPFGTGFFRPP